MVGNDLALNSQRGGGGLARPGSGATPDPGKGTSLSQVTFAGKGYTYAGDIPTQFRQGAAEQNSALALRRKAKGQGLGGSSGAVALYDPSKVVAPKSSEALAKIESKVIASGARQLPQPRRSLGRTVQRRIGWQATPTLIVITTAERELLQGDDGKYRPQGDWLIEHRKTYRNLGGAAAKRVGTIPDDPEEAPTTQGSTPAASSAATGGASADDAFPEGAFALSFLPSPVRSSVRGRVPNPTVFDGTSLQFSDPQTQKPSRLEVNVIRMDEKRAVVVQATKVPGETSWSVSQATYALGEPEVEQV